MGKRLTPEEKIINIVNKRNLSPQELEATLRGVEKSPTRRRTYNHYMGEEPFKIGIISDTHIGQEHFKPELMKYAGDVFRDVRDRVLAEQLLELMRNTRHISLSNKFIIKFMLGELM